MVIKKSARSNKSTNLKSHRSIERSHDDSLDSSEEYNLLMGMNRKAEDFEAAFEIE